MFLRKRALDEVPSDDEAVFMAVAENIGYDSTGKKCYEIVLEEEIADERIERHECDLFHWRVHKEWNIDEGGKGDWRERHREIIPSTGLIGHYNAFQEDPEPFFV